MTELDIPDKNGSSSLMEWNSSNISKVPDCHGAYFLWDVFDSMIYIGSSGDSTLKGKLQEHWRDKHIPGVFSFEWIGTDSREEASLLANILARQYNPICSDSDKDGQSFMKRVND